MVLEHTLAALVQLFFGSFLLALGEARVAEVLFRIPGALGRIGAGGGRGCRYVTPPTFLLTEHALGLRVDQNFTGGCH